MGTFLTFITYTVCVVFLGRFILHAVSWIKGVKQPSARPVFTKKMTPGQIVETVLDILLFRRLFKTSMVLWVASWIFHVSLFLVLVRHTWYFIDPVPDFIITMEPAGITAGYILPVSLLLIFIIRTAGSRDRYVSYYNFFIIGALFMISLTGLLMGTFSLTDVLDVKDFITGILIFEPGDLPDSPLFVVHFLFALLLVPCIPFHLFTAPIVAIEAKRREEGLDLVMHEK